MGKDFLSGVLALWFLYSFPDSVVITTAPTDRQVVKVIWGEITRYFKNSKTPLGGNLKTQDLVINEKWYATGFTTKETGDTIGKFQGFKGSNMLVIVTEAQAVESVVFEQIEGIMTCDNAKLYCAGNPLKSEGAFYKMCHDPSVKSFKWSCYDSPNYIHDREVIPGMVGRKWVKDKELRWGKKSPLFQARVLGQFPDQSTNSLVSIPQLEKAVEATPKGGKKVIGIDVARYGADSTVFAVVKGGDVRELIEHQGKATTFTEGVAINLIKKYRPDVVVVDEGAMGAGIIDHLYENIDSINRELGLKCEISGFKFGGKATISDFADRGTEAYYRVSKGIIAGDVRLPNDDELFSQIASRAYEFNSRGAMKLEPKERMKLRGLPSPDKADALVMALLESIEETENLPDEEEDYSFVEARINPETGYPIKEEVFI